MRNIRLSLCCISLKLQEQGIRASTMTKTRFLQLERQNAEKIVADRTLNNVVVTRKTLEFCASRKWNYRISSGMMPLETLPEANLVLENTYNFNLIKQEFDIAAETIRKNNIRCSTHPDQFVVIASANVKTVAKSIIELHAHGKMMDYLQLPRSYQSPINIHMNSFKGADIKDIAKRFIDVYNDLDESVKTRLVLENEDKLNSWNVEQLYEHVYQQIGIPITYDNLHFRCNPGRQTAKQAMQMAISTWSNFVPLFHFSDNDPNEKNPRSHGNYVREFPDEYRSYNDALDLEMEFKAKDYAIEKFETELNNQTNVVDNVDNHDMMITC
jgi:UV DNA damage endonuclease